MNKIQVTDETGATFLLFKDAYASVKYEKGSSPLATKPTASRLVALFKYQPGGQPFAGKAADEIFAAFSKDEPTLQAAAIAPSKLVAA